MIRMGTSAWVSDRGRSGNCSFTWAGVSRAASSLPWRSKTVNRGPVGVEKASTEYRLPSIRQGQHALERVGRLRRRHGRQGAAGLRPLGDDNAGHEEKGDREAGPHQSTPNDAP